MMSDKHEVFNIRIYVNWTRGLIKNQILWSAIYSRSPLDFIIHTIKNYNLNRKIKYNLGSI